MGPEEDVRGVGLNMPSEDLSSDKIATAVDVRVRYDREREKRLNEKGVAQYIDLRITGKYERVYEDPAVEVGTPVNEPVPDGGHSKILIIGAGFSGILFAAYLIKSGIFTADDLLIVDPAGGFGGTWFFNRYPGLVCDVESYIYLPLLEEMDYIPKYKYSSGHEIRAYAESIADEYGLRERAMFQSSALSLTWDNGRKEWRTEILEKPKGRPDRERKITVRSNFAIINTGLLNNPKLPDLLGIDDFKGHMFHTARWDWKFTGGSEEEPYLTGLEGKSVAVVGTGATCVQALPHIARHASKVYVFQRTPSAVDVKGNHETDPQVFRRKVASEGGWWRRRAENFNEWTLNTQPSPEVNMVNDQWTKMASYSALQGSSKEVTLENLSEHISELHALDFPRQERLRKRTEEIVKDQKTAKQLQAWYPGWCKRPTFHNEYLQSYNRPGVYLVHTDGRPIDRVMPDGIKFDGKTYKVDVIIWSTGFASPDQSSPAGRANMTVTGIDGQSLEERWQTMEWQSVHGWNQLGFPNMFWTGLRQAGASANFMHMTDTIAMHVAATIKQAAERVGSTKLIMQPTAEGARQWGDQVAIGAIALAGTSGCTPSYYNMEGAADKLSPEQQAKMARNSTWSKGFNSFFALLEEWRARGTLEGLEVTAAS